MLNIKETESNLYNPFVYPKEYFELQILFAQKTQQLNLSKDFEYGLLNYTLLYRNIVNVNPTKNFLHFKWHEFISHLPNDQRINDYIWNFYKIQPHSIYSEKTNLYPGERFGSFLYRLSKDLPTGEQKIELHFIDFSRHKTRSDLSNINLSNRQKDLSDLLLDVKNKMTNDTSFSPKWVTQISWINNLSTVRQLLPEMNEENSVTLSPPVLDFRSNSIWGQFINNQGYINEKRAKDFQKNINTAQNIVDLYKSFPLPVISF